MPEDDKRAILVVDDEPEVRKLVGAMVKQFGYEVITADSGEHAMRLYKQQKGGIAMLITDVVAPGMSGPMLADKLAALQPDLRVLYISGYDNTHVVQSYVVEKGHALLAKPFTLAELEAKMKKLLSAPVKSNAGARL
jgi:DNA-binding NtrC family response regulator